MNSTVDLLIALHAHLTEFELPAIASVHVTASISAPQVTVQLTCHEPSAITQGLLTWANTLTKVTAAAWRVPCGDSVHLSVTGLLPGGASVLVYGGMKATHRGLDADLAPDATTTIPLAALRHTASIEEARA
jgi:FtsP/CotA-like multicopper oxidase with cupredoxin domain